MMKLKSYLAELIERNDKNIFFRAGHSPQSKRNSKWVSVDENLISQTWLIDEVRTMLTDFQKENLNKLGYVVGQININDRNIEFKIGKSINNIWAFFETEIDQIHIDKQISPTVLEVLKKTKGLTLISGQQNRIQLNYVLNLIEEISKKNSIQVALFSDFDIPRNSCIEQFNLCRLSNFSSCTEIFDFVVIQSENFNDWINAYKLSLKGSRVILVLPFYDVRTSIEGLIQNLGQSINLQSTRNLELFLSQIQLCIGVKLIEGIELKEIYATEVLFMTEKLKEILLNNKWQDVQNEIIHSGMKTMNQSILEMVLKRKIDMKIGFQESPNPNELDQMLQKIGF